MALKHELKRVSFEDAVSMTGYGFYNILLLLACGGCLMCVIIETMMMMFIVPAAQCDLNLTLANKGILSSISFFGVVASSYMWGYIADTRGRKNVLVMSLAISSISTIIGSFVNWSWLFIVLRFINGLSIGGASSVVYAYAGEFHDNSYRPKVISWMSSFVAFGNMYLPGMAWVILEQQWSFELSILEITYRPWRLLMIIYSLPCLVVALAIYFLPESPKFLLTQERNADALKILKRMHGMNCNSTTFEVEELVWEQGGEGMNKRYGMFKSIWKQTVPLFRKDLLLKTLMICYMQFGVFASNSGITMWYPEILNRMSQFNQDQPNVKGSFCEAFKYEEFRHNSTLEKLSPKNCSDTVYTDVFLVSLVIGMAYAMQYIIIGSIINIIGKKKLMICFVIVTTTSGMVAQFFVLGYTETLLLLGAFLMGGAAIGITNAIAVDLFPTHVKAMAMAVALMFGRIGAMAGTNIVGPILYNFCDSLFYFVAVDHILLIIVVILLPSPAPAKPTKTVA